MVMQIKWTEQSRRALDFIMTCSRDFYSLRQLKQLRYDIARCEGLLTQNPFMGAVETDLEGLDVEYRHIVLTKPFKIIYFVWNNTVFIADIWDTRQDPATNKKRFS